MWVVIGCDRMSKHKICSIVQIAVMTLIILLLFAPCLKNANNNISGISAYYGINCDALSFSISGLFLTLLMLSGLGFAIVKLVNNNDKVKLVMNILIVIVGIIIAIGSFLGNKDIILTPKHQGVTASSLGYTIGFGFMMNGFLALIFSVASLLDQFIIGN